MCPFRRTSISKREFLTQAEAPDHHQVRPPPSGYPDARTSGRAPATYRLFSMETRHRGNPACAAVGNPPTNLSVFTTDSEPKTNPSRWLPNAIREGMTLGRSEREVGGWEVTGAPRWGRCPSVGRVRVARGGDP